MLHRVESRFYRNSLIVKPEASSGGSGIELTKAVSQGVPPPSY